MKKRAFISVFDKTGLEKIGQHLFDKGYEIISTGGTYRKLIECGVEAVEIKDITGFPEILDGRVKSLHPSLYGGILARRENEKDMNIIEDHEISPVDLVIVNLYPFFSGLDKELSHDEMIELIDIGGPSVLRAASKNYKHVLPICDPSDYDEIIARMDNEELDEGFRRRMAFKVFNHISSYDGAIAGYLLDEGIEEDYATLSYKKETILRYGENSHQEAALYLRNDGKGFMNNMEILSGKQLSYNNLRDMDIAWKSVNEFEEPACITLKHNTPCGAAIGESSFDAYMKAYSCDMVSVFGGIVSFNRTVGIDEAKEMNKIFLEIVMAPDFTEEALDELKRKKNLRVVKCEVKPQEEFELISVDGGILKQKRDNELFEKMECVTKRTPDEKEKRDMIFGMKICKYIKSNGLVAVKDGKAVGIGTGQVNRIWAAEEALERGKDVEVLVSDGFFPFKDVVELAGKLGVKSIMQPGGSIRDGESIEAADRLEIGMILTGMRHFKH